MRIAICTNFLSPYRVPVFAAIAEQSDADVRVFTSTDMEFDRHWDAQVATRTAFDIHRSRTLSFRHRVSCGEARVFSQHLERHVPISLPADLARFRPDVVISGELGPRTILASITGRCLGTPVIPWTYHPSEQKSLAHKHGRWRRKLLANAPAVIGMGSQARSVLISCGCPNESIFDAPNAADVTTIQRRREDDAHRRAVKEIRSKISTPKLAIVAGRLTPMKGIEELIRLWTSIDRRITNEWTLAFVGDGPLRSAVDAAADPRIRAIGAVQPHAMVDWHAAADLHVFASLGDPWGLVVNEAMQCGTPTLCSRLAGCADDLVVHGRNGFIFDPTAPAHAEAHIVAAALQHPDLDGLGTRARRDVHTFTPDAMARGMLDAVDHALSRRDVQMEELAR